MNSYFSNAPASIHCLTSVNSSGVKFRKCLALWILISRLPAELPGTTTTPSLPPFITPAKLLKSKLAVGEVLLWQAVH